MPDYLTQVEEQLVALTEQGRHRRRSRVADAALLAVPVAVVVAVVVAVGGVGGGIRHGAVPGRHIVRRHPRGQTVPRRVIETNTVTTPPRTNVSPPAGGPVPSGFAPESFTAIGEYTWWLLGTARCSGHRCLSVVRTTDGGRSFVGIPAPRASGVTQMRFADSRNGFAYAPQLWVTHDGGESWHNLRVHGVVDDLFASAGWVYAVVFASDGHGVLLRSPVGVDRWTVAHEPVDTTFRHLWVRGREVVVSSSAGGSSALLVSHDRGERFSRYRAPSPLGCQFQAPSPPVIWAQCATGSLSGAWRSPDGGRTFTGTAEPLMSNAAVFGAASSTTAVAGYQKLYRTTDGGATWALVPGLRAVTWWDYLGFTDPTHGVALGYVGTDLPSHTRLYYTTDGGASYHLVRIR